MNITICNVCEFINSIPAGFAEIASAGIFLPLVGYDRRGRSVFLVRFGAIRPASMTVDNIYRWT